MCSEQDGDMYQPVMRTTARGAAMTTDTDPPMTLTLRQSCIVMPAKVGIHA
jgi:hypothetical protein